MTIGMIRTLVPLLALAAGWGFVRSSAALQAQERHEVTAESASVQGLVVDHETREPLKYAAVSLMSAPGGGVGIGTRITDDEGYFHFGTVPPGTYQIIVSRLGYQERRDSLQVEPEEDLDVLIALSMAPVPMDPIVVEARRRAPPFFWEGFLHRREVRSGTFFSREDIEHRGAIYFTDLLRMVPGARVTPSRLGQVVTLRGGCRPQLWVDGVRTVTSLGMDDILPTMDVAAVEVYHGLQTPAEFGTDPCGTIVVWTRRGEPGPATGSFWKRLAVAAGFLTLAIFLTR